VHRDLKPANVMVVPGGSSKSAPVHAKLLEGRAAKNGAVSSRALSPCLGLMADSGVPTRHYRRGRAVKYTPDGNIRCSRCRLIQRRTIMRQLAFATLLACALVACADRGSPVEPAVGAAAATPSAVGGPPAGIEDSYVSTTCRFPMLVELSGKLKELPLPGGRVKVLFPAFNVTLTNLSTGKQKTISSTGSFHITALPDGNTEIVYRGRNTYDDPVAGRFLLLIGQFREVFDPDFNPVEPLDGVGRMIDLCALLG